MIFCHSFHIILLSILWYFVIHFALFDFIWLSIFVKIRQNSSYFVIHFALFDFILLSISSKFIKFRHSFSVIWLYFAVHFVKIRQNSSYFVIHFISFQLIDINFTIVFIIPLFSFLCFFIFHIYNFIFQNITHSFHKNLYLCRKS